MVTGSDRSAGVKVGEKLKRFSEMARDLDVAVSLFTYIVNLD